MGFLCITKDAISLMAVGKQFKVQHYLRWSTVVIKPTNTFTHLKMHSKSCSCNIVSCTAAVGVR